MKSSNSLSRRDDLILVGRIVGAHGIAGNLKLHSYADSLDLYAADREVEVAAGDGTVRSMTIQWARPHGRALLLHLASVNSRDQAEALVGAELYLPKALLPPLEEDTYYWFELVGLTVVDTSGSELGRLESVIPTPANDVYVVKGVAAGQPQELLIPAIGEVVVSIDLQGGTMVVDPPEGL